MDIFNVFKRFCSRIPGKIVGSGRRRSGFLTALLLWGIGFTVYAQDVPIRGTVYDGQGVPLPGASVVVKGTSQGTQTDFDGNFSLNASEGEVLVFSYIGFVSQEVVLGLQTEVDVTLVEDLAQLDEVVVTGYGKQSRAKLTTSVAKLDTRILNLYPF